MRGCWACLLNGVKIGANPWVRLRGGLGGLLIPLVVLCARIKCAKALHISEVAGFWSLCILFIICPKWCMHTVTSSPFSFLYILLLEETYVQVQARNRIPGPSLSHLPPLWVWGLDFACSSKEYRLQTRDGGWKSLVSLPFAFKPCSTSTLPNSPSGAWLTSNITFKWTNLCFTLPNEMTYRKVPRNYGSTYHYKCPCEDALYCSQI